MAGNSNTLIYGADISGWGEKTVNMIQHILIRLLEKYLFKNFSETVVH